MMPVPGVTAWLRSSSQATIKDEFELGHHTIWRHPDNTLQSPTSPRSREHAQVVRQPDGVTFPDPGSLNGSFLRGERVSTSW
jgi:pSer/pThr/pTyr-binding forkhead associated (FHA) protein